MKTFPAYENHKTAPRKYDIAFELRRQHAPMTPDNHSLKPRTRRSLPSSERGTWHMIHTDTGLVVAGERLPHIHRSPLRLAGREHQPGARFVHFGGKKTSAGFESLDFRGFEPMTYIGQILDQHIDDQSTPPRKVGDLPLALFRQGDKPAPAYYAWYYCEKEGVFIWGTPALAARVIEHDQTRLESDPEPERANAPSIDSILAKAAAQGLPEKAALDLVFKTLGKGLRMSRRAMATAYRQKASGPIDLDNWPTWWECADCWHSWRHTGALPLPCPACGADSGAAIARSWRKDQRPLFDSLDIASGRDPGQIPQPPL